MIGFSLQAGAPGGRRESQAAGHGTLSFASLPNAAQHAGDHRAPPYTGKDLNIREVTQELRKQPRHSHGGGGSPKPRDRFGKRAVFSFFSSLVMKRLRICV